MYIVGLMDVLPREAGEHKEKGVMFIPFLRAIARRVIAIHPKGQGKNTATLSLGAPGVESGMFPRFDMPAWMLRGRGPSMAGALVTADTYWMFSMSRYIASMM